MNPHKGLVNDMQPAMGQQPVAIGYPPIGGVLNREHRLIGSPRAHRLDHILKCAAGKHLHLVTRVAARLVTIRAELPLNGNFSGHQCDFPAKLQQTGISSRCLYLATGEWKP